jgi:ABC-2 type transport system ATP-binding protein
MIAPARSGIADSMPAPKPASVSVSELAKRYGPVEALRGVTFEVFPGEIFGLLGPNGAGKTTALECILGLRRPDSGAIAIAGIDALARPREARRTVGAQIQAATLQDKITPRRALRLFASFYGDHADVGELLGRFGLVEKADSPFQTLSAGQRQRVFLALAFVNNPGVVILDEPTAGLDPRSRRELHEIIAGIRESGRTVLLSTHDLAEAEHLCDRIGIVDRGRIVAAASPVELIAGSLPTPAISVKTARPMEAHQLEAIAGVSSCSPRGGGWLIRTTDANATMAGLVKWIDAQGNELIDLQIQRPSLEDAYLSLTGQAWPLTPKEDE